MSSQQTELGFNVLCFCSFCESPTQHFHLCLTLPVYWASMSLSSRLHGRRSRPWRPVWRTSFLGRAKWSTWFAPWSRRDQLTRRPSNACVRAFPPTPWQMWRWPRSRQELTGKPKLQPRSPDGKSGSLLWLVDCTGHRLRRQTEVNKWTLIILGEEKPRSSAVVVLWEKNGSKLEMCGLFVVNTHLWLSADKRVVGGWMQTVPSLLCLYLCHCWCWGEMHSILPCWDFPQEITGRFFLVLFFFFLKDTTEKCVCRSFWALPSVIHYQCQYKSREQKVPYGKNTTTKKTSFEPQVQPVTFTIVRNPGYQTQSCCFCCF